MTTKHIYLVSLISLGWLISTGCSSVTNFEDNIISSDNSNSETDSDTNIQKEEEEAVAQKVEELLATLTLDEKIGQMVQGQFEDATTNVIRNYCLGSVFSGGEEPVNPNNPENWADSIDAMQQAALDGCGIPILYGIDAVHGNGKVIGSTVFPHNIGLGASRDEELIEQIGRATGIECRGAGIHLTFAPAAR